MGILIQNYNGVLQGSKKIREMAMMYPTASQLAADILDPVIANLACLFARQADRVTHSTADLMR